MALDEEFTSWNLSEIRKCATGETPETEQMIGVQKAWNEMERKLLKQLGLEKFEPRFDDYKLSMFQALVEKMDDVYRKYGDQCGAKDYADAYHVLTLMTMTRLINAITQPEDHQNDVTALLSENVYFEAEKLLLDMDNWPLKEECEKETTEDGNREQESSDPEE